jgi:hypothetical protein
LYDIIVLIAVHWLTFVGLTSNLTYWRGLYKGEVSVRA